MGVAPLVTVILPTFDHVETLRYSIPTVLTQTHANLELFVIGDGAPEQTATIVEGFAAADARVKYRRFDKGPRNGEAHRHRLLLNEARGAFVFYIGDDDLWLPAHVETMLATFRATGANFVCCQPTWIRSDDRPAHRWVVDLALPWYRSELLEGRNRVPLNCGAHSMELYRNLPHGWRTTPPGTPTDLYMWQQILDHADCVAASTPFTTVIGLPSSERGGATSERRLAELAAWTPTTDPQVQLRFLRATQSAEAGLLAHASYEAEYTIALGVVQDLQAHFDEVAAVSEARYWQLRAIHESRGWRILERLRGLIRPRGREAT